MTKYSTFNSTNKSILHEGDSAPARSVMRAADGFFKAKFRCPEPRLGRPHYVSKITLGSDGQRYPGAARPSGCSGHWSTNLDKNGYNSSVDGGAADCTGKLQRSAGSGRGLTFKAGSELFRIHWPRINGSQLLLKHLWRTETKYIICRY